MTRTTFNLFLTLTGLAAFGALWGLDTALLLKTIGGQQAQAAVWREASAFRVFLAFEVLAATISCLVLGYVFLWLRLPAARWLWPLGLIGVLAYYRLDPRYQAEELPLFLRGVLVATAGVLAGGLTPQNSEIGKRKTITELILVAAFFVGGIFIARLATGAEFKSLWSIEKRALFTLIFLFSAGSLAGSVLSGQAARRPSFDSREGDRSRRNIVGLSFLISAGICLVSSIALILWSGRTEWLPWTLASPFVAPILAVYGPYSWFALESGGGIFSLSPMAGADPARARLFLGITFQYVTIFSSALVWSALRAPRSNIKLLAAHLALLVCWFPGLWLFWTLANMS